MEFKERLATQRNKKRWDRYQEQLDKDDLKRAIEYSLMEQKNKKNMAENNWLKELDKENVDPVQENSKLISDESARLKSQIRRLERKLLKEMSTREVLEKELCKLMDASEVKPLSGTETRTKNYTRVRGKTLSGDEKRAVLHCLEQCLIEKRGSHSVSTSNPILRTAVYFGIAERTVKDLIAGGCAVDSRGKHERYSSLRLFAADLRQHAAELNLSGSVVTINRLRKHLQETWLSSYNIPSKEAIRRIMIKIGFKFDETTKTTNFVETYDIKKKRREYLQKRYSEEFKDAMFVWLDESYCNQHHTKSKVCFRLYQKADSANILN